jgi:hypothetical protein
MGLNRDCDRRLRRSIASMFLGVLRFHIPRDCSTT